MRRSLSEWMMAAEAVALLGVFRMWLAVMPARRIVPAITRGRRKVRGVEAGGARSERELEVARRVRWAVSAGARYSPVEFVCFPQTLAAYTMLRRRGITGTIVYGLARSAQGELQAHTWLRVGERIVVGGENASEFKAMQEWG